MSNFPTSFDDDTTLPAVNDNITEIGGEATNALRDAVFAIEQNIGLGAAGTTTSVAARLDVSLFPDGQIKASAITSLGLVTLPITDNQISATAQITESKLKLDHRTQDLFNYIRDLSNSINLSLGWVSISGVKLEPHLIGALYRHTLQQIDIDSDPNRFLQNKFRALRNNSDSYFLIDDMNDELLTHQWADGSAFTAPNPIFTFNGSIYPATYAHTSSGIFLNTSRFSTIPQTAQDLQQFAEFIDSSSIFLYGTRVQNLYSNGISRISRAASLSTDGYGSPLIPPTPAIAYLLNIGTSSSPVDDINNGDDIIEFKPSQADKDSNSFDAKFALVKVGDIIRINYGTIEVPFIIKEKKYIQSGGNKKYIIRIAGKNIQYSPNASVRIDKPLFNGNKFGVLSMAAVNNNFAATPSLIIGSPRGAQALGLGFNPDQFDASHYLLYLALYPTGAPQDGYTILPPIDVTGNKGATPGKYTLESIVASTNNAFREAGYNYRFTAFSYQGEFGIMLADSYNNAGFSILNAVVSPNGAYDQLGTTINFQNNAVGIFSDNPFAVAPDPLGFGAFGANIASPPFMLAYGSAEASQNPTKLFLPLRRQNYYVNGIEREKMTLEVGQALDGYGDGYWVGNILTPPNIFPGPVPTGRVNTTYRIFQNLDNSNLKVGKTIVVQSLGQGTLVNYGRFIIQSVTFGCAPNAFTDIEVYDAVHGTAISPVSTLGVGSTVAIYFNSDSVSFNKETATDVNNVSPFKRHFEVYIDQDGKTFTHERGRFNTSNSTIMVNEGVPLFTYSELTKFDLLKISPKLKGSLFGSVNKISLHMLSYDDTTGFFDGYLCSYDGVVFSHNGSIVHGRKGEITRFYDETNIDYIDVFLDINTSISSFNSTPVSNKILDIQLFPSLSLDQEILMIGTCQLNDVTNIVSRLRDERQFGNTSEKEFSTSALDFIALPERTLHGNGVIRGFDLADRGLDPDTLNPISSLEGAQIFLNGGMVLVNGKLLQINNEVIVIPLIKELSGILYNINWIICVNDKGEYQPIPLLDFDSILNTPNNSLRVFQAFNLVNGVTYYLDATTFSDLINNRKDLTPLYIVASITTPGSGIVPPSISLSITDIRKYVNDADTNLPLRLTSATAQGNFRTPISIFNWIKYNNTFNSIAFVKGADEETGVINEDIILDFGNTVIIDGENNAILTMNGQVTIGSNLIIKNLEIRFLGGIIVNSTISNLTFQNCTIVIEVPVTPPANNIIFDFVNSNNITVTDCDMFVHYNALFNAGSVFRGAIFRLTNTTDFKFINTNLSGSDGGDSIFTLQAGTVTPGNIFDIHNSSGTIVTDSNFIGNFNKFFNNDQSNDVKLININLTSTYNPNAGLTPDSYGGVPYSLTNLVNSGQGWIYSNVASNLDNFQIENVTFNYNPTTQAGSAHRYSFINFELSNVNAIINNLVINNCKFNNLVAAGQYDDVRSAIAIINIAPSSIATNQQPIINNAIISNNSCNKNQSIVVTSKLNSGSPTKMVYPGLATINCNITNNICGTVGYWISSGSKTISLPSNVTSLSDKITGLTIKNNNCHYIASLDSTGMHFRVLEGILGDTNRCDYPSGNVIISENKTSWINTGISFELSSSLKIINNILNAYDKTYLSQFDGFADIINVVGDSCAISVLGNKHVSLDTFTQALGEAEGNDSTVQIIGNSTSTGYWLTTISTINTYKYDAGYVFCEPSNIIKNNIFKGIGSIAPGIGTSPSGIFVSGATNIITGNKIYREGAQIFGYVTFNTRGSSEWEDGVYSSGIIVDNFFDSPFRSDSSLSSFSAEQVIQIKEEAVTRWIFERNKNQTGYAMIPISEQIGFQSGAWGPNTNDPSYDTFITAMGYNSIIGTSSSFIRIKDYETASLRNWGFKKSIETYLPNNVRIIQIKAGLKPWDTTLVSFSFNPLLNNFLTLRLVEQNWDINTGLIDYTNTDIFSTITGADTTVSSQAVAKITVGEINAVSNSNIPISVNLEDLIDPITSSVLGDISYNYITGRGKGISLIGNLYWLRNSATMDITISPIQIKYRW
jgi:hypothetical protein